jgi:hypothetical protein
MARWNGYLTTLIKGESGGAVLTGVSYAGVTNPAVPAKHFSDVNFGVVTTGISGSYAIFVVGAVGGATGVIAGMTGVAANGSVFITGSSGGITGVPKPAYVQWASAEDTAGFTSSVFMAGEY